MIPPELLADLRVTDTAARVMAAVYLHAGPDGVYRGGYALLARQAAVGEQTVKRQMRLLEATGWVVERGRQGVTPRPGHKRRAGFTGPTARELEEARAKLEVERFNAFSRAVREAAGCPAGGSR